MSRLSFSSAANSKNLPMGTPVLSFFFSTLATTFSLILTTLVGSFFNFIERSKQKFTNVPNFIYFHTGFGYL